MSPKVRGPMTQKIPGSFLEMVATHAEVSQVVDDAKIKGQDLKRLIGASIVGMEHEARFKVESVWRKDRREFPAVLQASTNLMVDNARAQWTTFDILNQWIDNVKNKLIKTGLVVNEQVLDGEGALVSEV
jgi:capsid protein